MSRSRRRSALRLAARVALFALVGAAATVAVAWGCVLAGRAGSFAAGVQVVRGSSGPTAAPRWYPRGWEHFDGDELIGSYAHAAGGCLYRRDSIITWRPGGGIIGANRLSAGFPAHALRSDRTDFFPLNGTPASPIGAWHGVPIPAVIPRRDFNTFPIRPRPLGFALDTAVYGGLAFAVSTVPGFVRRRVRRRRGRCVACGYELQGLVPCPECGARSTDAEDRPSASRPVPPSSP